MGLTLDDFMAWKAEEMTMNTSSPCVAKSRDLVADFKKGIKQDPFVFPSLKHIENWPTFKRETMAQAFAQDVVNIFNPKYKPRGSEESPTPTDPDLDEGVRDILSHIFGEAHADGESDKLIASVTKQAASQHRKWSQPKAQDIPAADLRKMLSQRQRPDKPSVMINGVKYIVKFNDVMYQVSNHKKTMLPLALIDRGTNGHVAGSDTRLIDKSLRSVHIQGINNHMIKDVLISTVGAVVNTQRGEVIAIMHQYAYTGKGGTIHSSGQLEWCGNDVNDRSIKIDGGRQRLTTPDGYVIPINVRHGLPYITMRPFTDEEFEELPHVLWTSEDDWDPASLDSVISDDPNWYKAEPSPPLPDPMYDEYGEFRGRVLINQHEWQVHYFDTLDTKPGPDNDEFHNALEQFADDPDSVIDLVVYRANRARYIYDHERVEAAPKFVMTSEPDYGQLHPHLGWLPVDAIKKTFEHTTQLAHSHAHEYYTQEMVQVSESCLEHASS
jgi:hypothetical protein